MLLRYIFFFSFILSPQIAWGSDSYLVTSQAKSQFFPAIPDTLQKRYEGYIKKYTEEKDFLEGNGIQQYKIPFSTDSCINRCHVNYMAYQTTYNEKYFRHRNHSSSQGLECNSCHTNYVGDALAHGRLTIQDKDCMSCHHKDATDEDCLKCHAEVKEFMDGYIQKTIMKIPDWMTKDVSCKECHKLEMDGSSFKAVRDNCIDCHSAGYGVMYDLWMDILNKEIKKRCENESNIQRLESQKQPPNPFTFLFTDQINTTAEYLLNASPHLQKREVEGVKKLPKRGFLQPDIASREDLLKFIQSYGMHNILLSQMLLVSIEKEQQRLK